MKKNLFFFLMVSALSFADEIPTINVMGNGSVFTKPTKVKILATIETSDTDSNVANEKNKTIVSKTVDSLKKLGLKESDIKIENYSLNLRTSFLENKEKKKLFYTMNQISISTEEISKTSDFLDTLNKSGVTNINNIEFLVDNRKDLENKAYQLAYENAKEKATNIANLENLKISPKEINLISYPVRPILYKTNSTQGESGVPITIPENIEISTNINATFYMFKK